MKQKLTIIAAVLIVATAIITIILAGRPLHSDACTHHDRVTNNCVPAGRCTLPGDPREAVIDCAGKNYDHKYRRS